MSAIAQTSFFQLCMLASFIAIVIIVAPEVRKALFEKREPIIYTAGAVEYESEIDAAVATDLQIAEHHLCSILSWVNDSLRTGKHRTLNLVFNGNEINLYDSKISRFKLLSLSETMLVLEVVFKDGSTSYMHYALQRYGANLFTSVLGNISIGCDCQVHDDLSGERSDELKNLVTVGAARAEISEFLAAAQSAGATVQVSGSCMTKPGIGYETHARDLRLSSTSLFSEDNAASVLTFVDATWLTLSIVSTTGDLPESAATKLIYWPNATDGHWLREDAS